MSKFIAFESPDGSHALLEVSDEEIGVEPGESVHAGLGDQVSRIAKVATTSLEQALTSALQANVIAIHASVRNLTPLPSEIEFSFSLKATGEAGNMAVGKLGAEANYQVKLAWKSGAVGQKTN